MTLGMTPAGCKVLKGEIGYRHYILEQSVSFGDELKQEKGHLRTLQTDESDYAYSYCILPEGCH